MTKEIDFLLEALRSKHTYNFRPDHVDYLKVFKQLRGYFGRGGVVVGGSYVYSKELELDWNGKDIDVFLLIPRMESWALQNILNLVFDSVEVFDCDNPDFMKNKANYYKIEGQWKRVIAYKNSMMYDLIFVNASSASLLRDTGSTISRLYYQVTYNEDKTLQLLDSYPIQHLVYDKKCYINRLSCTEAYASKIEKLCKQLNLKVINNG